MLTFIQSQCHRVSKICVMVDDIKEVTAEQSCMYGQSTFFEHLFFLLISIFYFFFNHRNTAVILILLNDRHKPATTKATVETTFDAIPEPKSSTTNSPRVSVRSAGSSASTTPPTPASPALEEGHKKKGGSPPPRPPKSALDRLDTLIKGGGTLERREKVVNGEAAPVAGAAAAHSVDINLKGRGDLVEGRVGEV